MESIQVETADSVAVLFKTKWIKKVGLLSRYLEEDRYTGEPIVLDGVSDAVLRAVITWLKMHEDEEPSTLEQLEDNRFNRKVPTADNELLNQCHAMQMLAGVINASYDLQIQDLSDTLVKYMANNLEGKTAKEMSEWLGIPLKKDEENRED
ncbi:hypothetical protein QR680_011945 [Steinernema hermaphroditum]|uniref:Skp1-related protein n=1 Tax=Steinernema hermaphroditum TaxID=289476 RepID=A0AA39LZM9_9BILA|nr:hypothetical protein QR680_011945 [Steinernema hermaphroditum]